MPLLLVTARRTMLLARAFGEVRGGERLRTARALNGFQGLGPTWKVWALRKETLPNPYWCSSSVARCAKNLCAVGATAAMLRRRMRVLIV